MRKKELEDLLRDKGKYLDPDVIEEIRNDYDDLIIEQDQEIDNLKSHLSDSKPFLFDVFNVITPEQRYLLYQVSFR